MANNLTLPTYSWTIDPDGAIRVTSADGPTAVRLWQATNPNGRDFRRSFTNPSIVDWTDTLLSPASPGVWVGNVATPAAPAARAFMIELTFTSPIVGRPYVFTTEVRVVSNVPLVAWPYYMPSNDPDGDAMSARIDSEGGRNSVAFGLAAGAGESAQGAAVQAAALPESPPALLPPEEDASELPLDELAWIDDDFSLDDDASEDAIDAALAALTDEY
jgi:hypothetical protein